jgi:hypothetical protein
MSTNPEQGSHPDEELDQTKELRLDDPSVADRDVKTEFTTEESRIPIAEGHVDKGAPPNLPEEGTPKPAHQPGGGER